MLQMKMLLKTVYDQLVTNVNEIDNSKLFKKTDYNAAIKKIEDKIPNYDKFTTTTEFDKLTE